MLTAPNVVTLACLLATAALLCAAGGPAGAPEPPRKRTAPAAPAPVAVDLDGFAALFPPLPPLPPATPVPPTWTRVRVLLTGYSPHDAIDGHHWSTKDTVTATGRDWREHPHGVAVDPRLIPYGTTVRLDGRTYLADDTGGVMRQQARRGVLAVDLRRRTTAAAARVGKRWVEMDVLTSDLTPAQRRRLEPHRVETSP